MTARRRRDGPSNVQTLPKVANVAPLPVSEPVPEAVPGGPRLHALDCRTVTRVSGPLVFIERARGASAGELVEVAVPTNERRLGQILEINQELAVVQVFQGTRDLDLKRTAVRLTGDVARLPVGPDLLGRTLDACGRPLDGGPPLLPVAHRDIQGRPLNPVSRVHPSEFIQTGISAIDGLNTLVRGQKLPIFSGFGLPADELAAQIASQARVRGSGEAFVVVFAAMGITRREASFFRQSFAATGAFERSVLFMNLADDPTIERLLLPRAALTAAEYLAFDMDLQVLVILTDMAHYCEALREVATAREELPGRRGYPGYMYTDLASIYERAGRLTGQAGSITQLVILTMPDDDITHPIPDLTGYITEGQIVLSRDLHRRGIDPPIDVLPSLSRLMNAGIGAGKTRDDHRAVASQLYALYASGRDLRRLVAIIGEGALSEDDRRLLHFADALEQRFVKQGRDNRSIEETLGIAWELMAGFPAAHLKRIPAELRQLYMATDTKPQMDTVGPL